MPDHCCVPGCTGNYSKETGYLSVFQFPKEEKRKNLWCKEIPRANFEPTKRLVVCERHFREDMIIREDNLPDKNGKMVKILRKRPMLKDDAYPSIFQGCPPYLSEKTPISRVSREEKFVQRSEEVYSNFVEMDTISNFSTFQSAAHEHIKHLIHTSDCIIHNSSSSVYILFMNFSPSPTVEKSILIDQDLNFTMFHIDTNIPRTKVQHIVSSSKLNLWSEFINIVTYVKCFQIEDVSKTAYEKAVVLWQEVLLAERDSLEYTNKHFILDQMKTCNTNEKGKRYSCNLTTFAYSLFMKSAASYRDMYESKVIRVPSPRHLKRLTSCLSLKHSTVNEENLKYLTTKCQKLESHEKMVNLLIDEIHVCQSIQFKGKQLSGVAENAENSSATSIQAFMVSSLKSKYKEIISLIPVKNMTAAELLILTKQALQLLFKAGFSVFSIISDNNRINRNMFKCLSTTNTCELQVPNPCDETSYIYLLFDSVHLVKSIRNNWLNQLNAEKTFICPKFNNPSVTEPVSFSLLRRIYNLEKDLLVKFAPKLNFKASYPSNIERQNVALALKVFDSTNCAALQKYGEEDQFVLPWLPTSDFIANIKKWWDVMNINHPKKGLFQRNPSSFIFNSIEDERLLFLEQFCSWLKAWQDLKQKSRSGCLSEETFFALMHTTKCIIHIIKKLLTSGYSYVLTAKFQTDALESRFGLYRQMSGSNFHVTVQEVIESERKLRVKSMLTFRSKGFGLFSIKTLSTDNSNASQCTDFDFMQLENILCEIEFSASHNEVEILTYIGGYCAHKLNLSCEECRQYYIIDSSMSIDMNDSVYLPSCDSATYINLLNRGGLKKPSCLVVNVLTHCFCIFKKLICTEHERIFLQSANQYNILVGLFKYYLKSSEIVDTRECNSCKHSLFEKIEKVINTFGNICLKNYCTVLNEKTVSALNERKLKKFKKM